MILLLFPSILVFVDIGSVFQPGLPPTSTLSKNTLGLGHVHACHARHAVRLSDAAITFSTGYAVHPPGKITGCAFEILVVGRDWWHVAFWVIEFSAVIAGPQF